MLSSIFRFVIVALLAVSVGSAAAGQTAKISKTTGATVIPVDPSTLYRVDEGVFQLREGQSVDLTDKRLMFTFGIQKCRDGKPCAWCRFRWRAFDCQASDHFDFKSGRQYHYQTRKMFAETSECFLDIVSITIVRGAPATGVFRLFCL